MWHWGYASEFMDLYSANSSILCNYRASNVENEETG